MTDLKISWSALRAHMECKQKGYLQRSGKKAKMENQRVFFPGTVTDRVVRDWLADDPYSNPGVMKDMVESVVQREQESILERGKQLRWKDDSDRDSIIRDCQKAVERIEPDLNELVLPYEYDVDFSFKAPMMVPHPSGEMAQILLIGFMDIIVRRPATLDLPPRWAVYDVKHTKDDYYWKKTRGQLSFYDLAVDVMFESQTFEVGLLQPLCKESKKMFTLEEQDRTILETHVLSMVDDIWRQNFEPDAPLSACTFCNVKHACSRFTPKNGKRMELF
jgi:hypothetical protein